VRIAQRTPRPTAPPTSSLPARAGRWVCGRDTKPRTWPPGGASTRMLPGGPSPVNWSDTRSSAFESPPSRSPAVSARPSAAVAVGSVPCRTRGSPTRSVVTAARPRTVPSAVSVRARRSATSRLFQSVHHVLRLDESDEPLPLAAVGAEEHVGRYARHLEAGHQALRALVALGHVDLEGGERSRRAHHRRIAKRRALHLAAGKAPRRLEVDQDRAAGGDGACERVVRERHPRDRAAGLRTEKADERE